MDESGFTMSPYIPYAWQKKGSRRQVRCRRQGKRLNVLGVLGLNGKLYAYYKTETVNSLYVEECIKDFMSRSDGSKPRVVILDNAPTHHSKAFKENIPTFELSELYLFYLPRYSPHLNIIEHLWRKIKYYWLRSKDYKSWGIFRKRILYVLRNFGVEFKLNVTDFVQNKIPSI
jgi:transposase